MTILADLRTGLHTAAGNLRAFFVVHLAIRLIVMALIAPLGSMLLAAAIATSDQSALTDQDIARFLLTPWGFAAALAVISLTICAAVLDLSVMTAILRHRARGGARAGARRALNIGLHMVLARAGALLHFAALLVLRIALIVAPFALAAGAIAAVTLRAYDINYYLTYMPPGFVAAAAVGALLALGLALVLLRRLSGWAIALHFLLFRGAAPREAFAQSTRRLAGHRRAVLLRIGAWAGVRMAIAASVSALAGALLSAVPGLFGAHLATAAAASLAILVVWGLVGALVSALANATLADMLDRLFVRVTPEVPRAPLPEAWRRTAGALPMAALALAALAAIGIGAFHADALLSTVRDTREVAVIAHRGAAATRPENTLAAVEKALEDRADWVEIDVQESADGEVIVAHDSDFMKLGGGSDQGLERDHAATVGHRHRQLVRPVLRGPAHAHLAAGAGHRQGPRQGDDRA